MKCTLYFLGEMEAIIVLMRMIPDNSSPPVRNMLYSLRGYFYRAVQRADSELHHMVQGKSPEAQYLHELVLDYCCVSISVQVLGTKVS